MRLIEEHEQLLAKIRPDKKYKIIRSLDDGGSQKNTSVYECVSCTEEIANAPHLAVKIITVKYGRNEDKRFRRQQAANEISLLNKLNRPGVSNHIIGLIDYTILDMDDKDEGFYLVLFMPVFKSLADLEEEHINDTQEQALALLKKLSLDISEALRICHQNGIVHRDLKPENIFVNEEGDFLLADFGFAKELQDSGSVTSVGTENYAAPEVIRHEIEPTQEAAKLTDIYSFGIVLYQLANHWTLPFYPAYPAKYTAADAAKAHYMRVVGTQNLALPDNCPMELGRFITKMCSHNPTERPQTIEEVEAAFHSYFDPAPKTQYQDIPTIDSGHLNEFQAAMAVYQKIFDVIIVHFGKFMTEAKSLQGARRMTDEETAKSVSIFLRESDEIKKLCKDLGYSDALQKCRLSYDKLWPEEQETQKNPYKYFDIEKDTYSLTETIKHREPEAFVRAEEYYKQQKMKAEQEREAREAQAQIAAQHVQTSNNPNSNTYSDTNNRTGSSSDKEQARQPRSTNQTTYYTEHDYPSYDDTVRSTRRKTRVRKKLTVGKVLLVALCMYLLGGVGFAFSAVRQTYGQKKPTTEISDNNTNAQQETISEEESLSYHTMYDVNQGAVRLYSDVSDVANRTYDKACVFKYDKVTFDVSQYERFVGYVVMGGDTNTEDKADIYFYIDDKNEEIAKVTVSYIDEPIKIDIDLRGISELTILQDRQADIYSLNPLYAYPYFYLSYEDGNNQANETKCPYTVDAQSGYLWDMRRWKMHFDGTFEQREDVTVPGGDRYRKVYYMQQFMSNWGKSSPAIYPLTGAYSRFITYIMPAEENTSGEMTIQTDIEGQTLTIPISGDMGKQLIDINLSGANWLTISFTDMETKIYLYEPRIFMSEEEANEYLSSLEDTPDYTIQ